MTMKKLLKLYRHYKNDYDFRLRKMTFKELEDYANHDGEFLRD